jgi:hypothetical protein
MAGRSAPGAIGLDAVPRWSSCHALLLFVLGCLPVLMISGYLSRLPAVLGGELFNPDSYMRRKGEPFRS